MSLPNQISLYQQNNEKIVMGGCLTMLITSICALCTLKPIYMQLYWINSLLVNGFLLLGWIVFTIVKLQDYWSSSSANQEVQEKMQGRFYESLVIMAVMSVFIVWGWCIAYSFYSYVRDRQLYSEQYVPKPINVVVESPQSQYPQLLTKMTWCWRPERIVDREPLPTDYRCCFGCCTSKCGFTFITVVNLGIVALVGLLLLSSLLLGGPIVRLIFAIPIALMFLWLYPFVQAIRTEKPVYMQIVWITNLIFTSLGFLYFIVLAIASLITMSTATDDRKREQAATLVAGAIIRVVFDLWNLCLIYSFYSYLRDRQLWLEGRETYMPKVPHPHHMESAPMYEP
ncbi:unnamed protein product, partial [Mesorhabditis belari]|uniref:Uncharacterized protein n=1 Tax=Mesorhabditis belari TaxID=2138241 RepID=A0AAF3J5S1_9BILA